MLAQLFSTLFHMVHHLKLYNGNVYFNYFFFFSVFKWQYTCTISPFSKPYKYNCTTHIIWFVCTEFQEDYFLLDNQLYSTIQIINSPTLNIPSLHGVLCLGLGSCVNISYLVNVCWYHFCSLFQGSYKQEVSKTWLPIHVYMFTFKRWNEYK